MKNFLLVTALVTLLISSALAQSSGSFNFNANTTACTDIGGLLGGGVTQTALSTTLKVSNGQGIAALIRPSAVVGLLTDLSLSGKFGDKISTGSAQATVSFQVTVTPLSGQPAPTVTPSDPVVYDDRFMQISTNLFGKLAECTADSPCTFDFDETTLSAHSFDFVVTNLDTGNYGFTVTWTPVTTAQAPNEALACVGPVVLTAEQVKIFKQSQGIQF
jgi:hypothetical protein